MLIELIFLLIHALNVSAQDPVVQLEDAWARFEVSLERVESGFDEMRRAVRAGDSESALTVGRRVQKQKKNLSKRWLDVQSAYETVPKKLALANIRLTNLRNYLLMKRHSQDPLIFTALLRSWRGLHFGEKTKVIPENLKQTEILGREILKATDPAVIIFVNGGIVRGMILGWKEDGSIVIAEALPKTLAEAQKRMGRLRIVKTENVARIEIIRRLSRTRRVESFGPSVLDSQGNYGLPAITPGFASRFELQPDNESLLRTVLDRENPPAFEIRATSILGGDFRPVYAPLPFLECDSFLNLANES